MKFKSDIEVQAGLKDSSGSNGTSGQVLSTTGSTVSWINQTTIANDVQNLVKAGVAINKGQAVYVTGADGTNIIVGLASNTSEATSSKTLGLLNATVAINGMADVVQIGRLAGLNTIGATVGDPVWLGTNGNLIYGLTNKPYAPAHLVFIGVVTRVNANNGEIFVNVQNGFELKEIHDVDIITNVPINGDVLGYDGTLWVNKTIAEWLGYTPANASGTTNYVSKFTGANSLGDSQIFDNGTNVGIGTNLPQATLQVGNGAGVKAIYVTGSGTNLGLGGLSVSFLGFATGTISTVNTSGAVPLGVGTRSTQPLVLGTNNAERMRIDSSGNVGIGTTAPSSLLDVNGVIRGILPDPTGLGGTTAAILSYSPAPYGIVFRGYSSGAHSIQVQRENNAAEMFPLTLQPNGGNVGIGTTTPTKILDVNGDALINTLTVGRGAGNNIGNSVLGYQSLFNNTTGDGNVAIGYQSLLANTTGYQNTVVGHQSGAQLTTGSRNIFIGSYTGGFAGACEYSTVIGGYLTPDKQGFDNNQTLSIEKPDIALNNYIGESGGLPHIWAPNTIDVGNSSNKTLVRLKYLLYSSIFMEYNLEDTAGNARAGTIKAVWNQDASIVKITEEATDDIGNTSAYLISFNIESESININLYNNGVETVYCNTTSRILIRPTIQTL